MIILQIVMITLTNNKGLEYLHLDKYLLIQVSRFLILEERWGTGTA